MKINKYLMIVMSLFALLAFAAASQIPQAAKGISVEEIKTCSTISYDDVLPVISDCTHYDNFTLCLNTSGPGTDCSMRQSQRSFRCQTDTIVIHKNKTECMPLNRFEVTIDSGFSIDKKEIDFSGWGACIQSNEDGCVAILCGSQHGGSAVNGIFDGCDGGKSCQKFLFCKDGFRVLYKGSGDRFVAEDPTFHLNELEAREVAK